MPVSQREGFHVSLAGVHGASWPSASTRSPAAPWDRPPAHRAHRPQTNGKAERFIRTMLSGWAYGAIYRNSDERSAALDGWLWIYNCQRRHSALGHKPSIARLDARRTNLLRT